MLFPNGKKGELKSITRPYLGEYECTRALLGDRDYLEDFDYVRLELRSKDEYVLRYRKKGKKEGQTDGKYRYEEGTDKLILELDERGLVTKEGSFQVGMLTFFVPLSTKNFLVQFERE